MRRIGWIAAALALVLAVEARGQTPAAPANLRVFTEEGERMALQVHTGATAWNMADTVGTTRAVSTTDRDGAGFDPVVVLFFAHSSTPSADGTNRNVEWFDSVGVATGTTSMRCVGIRSREGATTNAALRSRNDSVVAFRADDGVTPGGRLVLDQFGGGTNGFRYSVNEVLVDDDAQVQHVAFGGASGGVTNVAHGEAVLSGAGVQEITGLGFDPADGDLLIAWLASTNTTGNQSEDDYRFAVGVATKFGDDMVIATNANDDATTAQSFSYGRSGYLLYANSLTGTGATHRVEFGGWIPGGFRVNKLALSPAIVMQYAVIKGPRWAIRENLTRTSVTTFQETGLPARPRGGFVRSLVQSGESTGDTAYAFAQMGSAVWSDDGTDPPRQVLRTYHDDGGSRKFNGYQADAVQMSHSESTIDGILSISAIGATDLTYSQDDADTSQKWFYDVIGMDGDSTQPGIRTQASGNQGFGTSATAVVTAQAGDLIVVTVGDRDGGTPSSVSSSLDGAFTADRSNVGAGSASAHIYSRANCSAGSHTITVSYTGNAVFDFTVVVLKNMATSSHVHASNSATNASGTAHSHGSITTTAATIIITAIDTDGDSGADTPGTGMEELNRHASAADRRFWQYRISSGAETINPGYTSGNAVPSNAVVVAYNVAAGGTTHPLSVGGTITPAGVLVRQAGKAPAGSLAPTGAVQKTAEKPLAGATTPVGALEAIRTLVRNYSGTITPAAALAFLAEKLFAGSSSPAGALARSTEKLLAGSSSPSGTLETSLGTQGIAVGGTIAPSGAVARASEKLLAGSSSPAGAVSRSTARGLAGSVGPAGALETLAVKARDFAGALGLSGVLTRLAGKAPAGTVTPAGVLSRASTIGRAGSLAPAGSLAKAATKPLAGTATPAGSLATQGSTGLSVAGTIAPSGLLTRQAGKGVVGTVTPAGAVTRATSRLLAGLLTPVGSLIPGARRVLELVGLLTPAGAVSTALGGQLGDVLNPTATIARGRYTATLARGRYTVTRRG